MVTFTLLLKPLLPMSEYSDFFVEEFWRSLNALRPAFHQKALCKTMDNNLFFPGQGQSGKAQQAVEICFQCPVQIECHDYACKEKIEHGVWGGSTADQRKQWFKQGLTPSAAWGELVPE